MPGSLSSLSSRAQRGICSTPLSSRAKRGICSAVALAALAACEPPFEPFNVAHESRILVHAVLDPSADSQKVLVQETMAGVSTIVFNATVRITTPSNRVITLTRTTGTGEEPPLYARPTVLFDMVQGGTYSLAIDIPGRGRITGSTTLPRAPPTTAVELLPPFRVDVDTLRLSWPRVPGTVSHEVAILSREPIVASTSRYSLFADTSIELTRDTRTVSGQNVLRQGAIVNLVVMAVDDHYRTYFRAGVDPFAGAPPSQLTGAIGLFGAVVPVSRVRFVVRCNDPFNCPP